MTVFKDGHAVVVHEGRMPVNRDGDVELDYLPTPVLGTVDRADQGVRWRWST